MPHSPVETYDLPIFKEDSATGAKIGGAGLRSMRRLRLACGCIEQFSGAADAIEVGRTDDLYRSGSRPLMRGETTVPPDTRAAAADAVAPDDTSGWTFLNDPNAIPNALHSQVLLRGR